MALNIAHGDFIKKGKRIYLIYLNVITNYLFVTYHASYQKNQTDPFPLFFPQQRIHFLNIKYLITYHSYDQQTGSP